MTTPVLTTLDSLGTIEDFLTDTADANFFNTAFDFDARVTVKVDFNSSLSIYDGGIEVETQSKLTFSSAIGESLFFRIGTPGDIGLQVIIPYEIIVEPSDVPLTVGNNILTGSKSNDFFKGLNGRDTISGFKGNDTIQGNSGNDVLNGNNGNDSLIGGTGNDVINGGKGKDRLLGNSGNDRLFGGQLGDTLSGQSGDDLLNGNSGNDRLFGGSGSDTLIGGNGNDTLVGGEGSDIFVIDRTEFFIGTGTITIEDFNPFEGDLIGLSLPDGIGFDDLIIGGRSNGVDILFDDIVDITATFEGFDVSTLTESDFVII